ncbi:DsbA family protein [Paenibacillus glufosinatiresistens]|uniref:DsbA family protein n=1 Tax=Paenibacillus glufosinatiresistens TaxID=3070657 RepID=UPI00286E4758|nr:thioredoxin domain-containing protein [Paenibacillus sp. YX.27]
MNKQSSKTAAKAASKKEQRRAEQERAKRRNRIMLIFTAVVVIAVIAALALWSRQDPEFNYSELPRLGQADAPVKLVEFGDFKCPACADFTNTVKPKIVQDAIDTGKAAFYFVNMSFVGPDSETASLAALSVYHQNPDAFWKFYDAVYASQGDEQTEWATKDYLVSLAQKEKLEIDYDRLAKDIENATYRKELERDNKTAEKFNVTNTPSLFINGVKTKDPFNYSAVAAEIDKAAAKANP